MNYGDGFNFEVVELGQDGRDLHFPESLKLSCAFLRRINLDA